MPLQLGGATVAPAVLPGFLLVALLICVAPGPDMAFIIAVSIGAGWRAGVQSAVGMALGQVLWTVATAFGLAALLHTSPLALVGIRVFGAGYLLWLGVTTLRSARSGSAGPQEHAPAGRNFAVRGMLTNLTNPKVMMFFAAFLPQFVRASAGPASVQMLTLGGLFLLAGLGVDSLVALAAGRLRLSMQPGRRTATVLNVIAGITFCALAAGLAAGIG
jgi:threonine/homoserine/homoserine lactone efflux protein